MNSGNISHDLDRIGVPRCDWGIGEGLLMVGGSVGKLFKIVTKSESVVPGCRICESTSVKVDSGGFLN